MKNRVVIFGPRTAWVEKTDDISRYRGAINVLINPDFSKVHGTAPIYWKRVGQNILPMNPIAKSARALLLRFHNGESSDHRLIFKKKTVWGLIGHGAYVMAITGGAVAIGFYVLKNYLGG